jgi:hypothetical protein
MGWFLFAGLLSWRDREKRVTSSHRIDATK